MIKNDASKRIYPPQWPLVMLYVRTRAHMCAGLCGEEACVRNLTVTTSANLQIAASTHDWTLREDTAAETDAG